MTLPDIEATSQLYWASTLVTAVIDLGFISLLGWRIQPQRFRQLKWALTAAALIFWTVLWTTMVWQCWGWCYRYVFPWWARWLIPPCYGLIYGAGGLGLWWLAVRLPGKPVVSFCLLGGLISVPGHLWAIYGAAMLEKVPLLQGLSPAPALVFGVFEFIFYWGVIIVIAMVLEGLWRLYLQWSTG